MGYGIRARFSEIYIRTQIEFISYYQRTLGRVSQNKTKESPQYIFWQIRPPSGVTLDSLI
jgi:hypothetical protein